MLRVVLDTNVLVSAFIRPSGPPGRIVTFVIEEQLVLLLSPATLDELRRTLKRKSIRKYIKASDEELESRLIQLEAIADPVEGELALPAVVRDPNDLMFLIAAVEGRADCIVSGDDDLLALGDYEGIAILTPRAFLERIDELR